jgi:hypothetical protein
MLVELLLGMK